MPCNVNVFKLTKFCARAYKQGMKTYLILLVSLFAISARAEDSTKESIQVQENSAEVHWKIDPLNNKILVKINRDKNRLPESLQINLYDSKGRKTPITLKATDPWVESGGSPVSPHAYFSGSLMQAGQAYTGIEVKIPFGSEPKSP